MTKLIDMMCQAVILALCAVLTVMMIWGVATFIWIISQ
jgi:hypothetical protein